MTDFLIEGELADELRRIANQEHRSPQEVLRTLLSGYSTESLHNTAYSPEAVQARLYARARRYWQQTGDTARLALTDAQLNAQFWGFDADDIPRLNSDSVSKTSSQGTLTALGAAAEHAGMAAGSSLGEGGWEDDFATHLLRYRQSPRGE